MHRPRPPPPSPNPRGHLHLPSPASPPSPPSLWCWLFGARWYLSGCLPHTPVCQERSGLLLPASPPPPPPFTRNARHHVAQSVARPKATKLKPNSLKGSQTCSKSHKSLSRSVRQVTLACHPRPRRGGDPPAAERGASGCCMSSCHPPPAFRATRRNSSALWVSGRMMLGGGENVFLLEEVDKCLQTRSTAPFELQGHRCKSHTVVG